MTEQQQVFVVEAPVPNRRGDVRVGEPVDDRRVLSVPQVPSVLRAGVIAASPHRMVVCGALVAVDLDRGPTSAGHRIVDRVMCTLPPHGDRGHVGSMAPLAVDGPAGMHPDERWRGVGVVVMWDDLVRPMPDGVRMVSVRAAWTVNGVNGWAVPLASQLPGARGDVPDEPGVQREQATPGLAHAGEVRALRMGIDRARGSLLETGDLLPDSIDVERYESAVTDGPISVRITSALAVLGTELRERDRKLAEVAGQHTVVVPADDDRRTHPDVGVMAHVCGALRSAVGAGESPWQECLRYPHGAGQLHATIALNAVGEPVARFWSDPQPAVPPAVGAEVLTAEEFRACLPFTTLTLPGGGVEPRLAVAVGPVVPGVLLGRWRVTGSGQALDDADMVDVPTVGQAWSVLMVPHSEPASVDAAEVLG